MGLNPPNNMAVHPSTKQSKPTFQISYTTRLGETLEFTRILYFCTADLLTIIKSAAFMEVHLHHNRQQQQHKK